MGPWCWVLTVVSVGCYRPSAQAVCEADEECTAEDGGITDGMPTDDGPVSDSATRVCTGTPPMEVCVDPAPVNDLGVGVGFDTLSACPRPPTTLAGTQVCLVIARTITISGAPRFTGELPLVLAGFEGITINTGAVLDVASSATILPRIGAGSQPLGCSIPTQGTNGQDGSGGGSFAGRGGNGGLGEGGTQVGLAGAIASSISFRGGCRGAAGPQNTPAGPGGGAVYLVSEGTITINGHIEASGGGGAGGEPVEGGAGGGSGGFIGIDSAFVVLGTSGAMTATGGGGGGGGCSGLSGGAGANPDAADVIAFPGPGADTNPQGDGGFGGSQPGMPAGNGMPAVTAGCAGGGGGGGAGAIRIFRSTNPCGNKCTPTALNQ
jgi:hypothetical protein